MLYTLAIDEVIDDLRLWLVKWTKEACFDDDKTITTLLTLF